MSHHRRPKDREGNADHDRPIEIQGVRETRGGVSYDLRSPGRMKSNNTAANPKNGRHTLVFHRTERRDFDHDSEINSEYEGDPINSSQRRDSFYTQRDVEDQALSEDLSMPRLERRPSKGERMTTTSTTCTQVQTRIPYSTRGDMIMRVGQGP